MKGFKMYYSGADTEDFDLFCQQFQAFAELGNYTHFKKILAFQTRLTGNALEFYRTLPASQKDSLEHVIEQIKAHFEGDSWKWRTETKLLSRKQAVGETIDDYAADIMKMSAQVAKPAPDQISYFVRGLLPQIRSFVFSKEPKTLKEAIDYAKLGVTVQEAAVEKVDASIPSQVSVVTKDDSQQIELKNMIASQFETLSSRIDDLSEKFASSQSDLGCNAVGRTGRNDNNRSFYSRYNYRSNQGSHQQDRPHQGEQRYNNNRNPIVCFRCFRQGHIRRQCVESCDIYGTPLN